ncbi:hypothetical protein [Burkholderia gladioli]|uniref:hypothetical protein n=1 Tax=Burkholderia gladioli TaxID=28095 RepID=UPI0034DB3F96
MNLQSLARGLLRLRLALARFGTGPLAAGAALVCAALLWLGVLPGMAARVEDETRSAARLATLPPPRPVISAPELAADRLAGFYRGLGDSAHTGEIVTRLFEAAAAAGVTLDKAEYKPGHDTPGRFDTYTIVLPVKGDYAKLRLFSEKVLLAVPYAALDDMRFKRGSANDAGVEASLRFTAFLRPVTIAPLSASEVAAIEAAGGRLRAPRRRRWPVRLRVGWRRQALFLRAGRRLRFRRSRRSRRQRCRKPRQRSTRLGVRWHPVTVSCRCRARAR